VLAVICTLAINIGANRKYSSAARTVKAIQATEFIPAGEAIDQNMVKAADVAAQMAQNLETGDIAAVVGKSVKVSIMKDQYLMQDDMDTQGRDPGSDEIYFPVNVPSSACVIPGDYVDIYQKAAQNAPSVLLYAKAEVLHTVDSNAKQTEPGTSSGAATIGGGSAVVAVGVEVPDGQAAKIVGPASQNEIYLVKSAI
jgi:hypothetical protein